MRAQPGLGEVDVVRESSRVARIDVALARSVLYEALAIGFEPPGVASHARLGAAEAADALASAARLAESSARGALSRARLPETARRLSRRFARTSLDEITLLHARLFGHTARGAVVPYEVEYGSGDRVQATQELADIAGFLAAFGLVVSSTTRERPDHIAVECEFAAFLARKEAHALEARDDAMCEATQDATRAFLRDHLLRFGRAFAAAVRREDARGPYGALSEFFEGLLACEAVRWRLPLGPKLLSLRGEIADPVPMACESDPPFVPLRRAPGGTRLS